MRDNRRSSQRVAALDPSGRVPQHRLGKIQISGSEYQLLNLGAWSMSIGYALGNLVTSGGLQYVCIGFTDPSKRWNANDEPPSANWQLFDETKYYLRSDRTWSPLTADPDPVIWPTLMDLPISTGGNDTGAGGFEIEYLAVRGGAALNIGELASGTLLWRFPFGAGAQSLRGDNAGDVGGFDCEPLFSLAFFGGEGSGGGTMTMYIAGAYDLSATSAPALDSTDWLPSGAVTFALGSSGTPFSCDMANLAEVAQGVNEDDPATSREGFGGWGIAKDKPLFQKSTSLVSNTLDGGPGYYFLRLDFSGLAQIWGLHLRFGGVDTFPAVNLTSPDNHFYT